MKKRSGSVLLWSVFSVLLACLVMIVYAIYSTSRQNAKRSVEVYVEKTPVSSPDPDTVVEFKKPLMKSAKEREEEERIREVMAEGVL